MSTAGRHWRWIPRLFINSRGHRHGHTWQPDADGVHWASLALTPAPASELLVHLLHCPFVRHHKPSCWLALAVSSSSYSTRCVLALGFLVASAGLASLSLAVGELFSHSTAGLGNLCLPSNLASSVWPLRAAKCPGVNCQSVTAVGSAFCSISSRANRCVPAWQQNAAASEG